MILIYYKKFQKFKKKNTMKKVKVFFIPPVNGLQQIDTTPIDQRINAKLQDLNITIDKLVNIQVHQDSLNNQGNIIIYFSASITYIEDAITEN
jgi:hypothetical protein